MDVDLVAAFRCRPRLARAALSLGRRPTDRDPSALRLVVPSATRSPLYRPRPRGRAWSCLLTFRPRRSRTRAAPRAGRDAVGHLPRRAARRRRLGDPPGREDPAPRKQSGTETGRHERRRARELVELEAAEATSL